MVMNYRILRPHDLARPSGYAVNILGPCKIPPRSALATQLSRHGPADDGALSNCFRASPGFQDMQP